ncbi:WD40 repeat-like protein [Auricularia subglabra TFB-10046 SS5]|nr:WD40 repeat-like protein [Auricularia subglabra TFB-10046 SS5]
MPLFPSTISLGQVNLMSKSEPLSSPLFSDAPLSVSSESPPLSPSSALQTPSLVSPGLGVLGGSLEDLPPGEHGLDAHPLDPSKCPTCGTGGGRNLVICIDGTSNQFSVKNTNVVELYSRLVKDDNQLTFYNSGIGTYAEPSWKSWDYRKQVLLNKLDLMFALGFEKIMLSAYAWLVDHYQPGDRIFLFGFSRGAYQVRALAAMIDSVGLLHKGNNDQIPFAYELYAASGSHKEHPGLHESVSGHDERSEEPVANGLAADQAPMASDSAPRASIGARIYGILLATLGFIATGVALNGPGFEAPRQGEYIPLDERNFSVDAWFPSSTTPAQTNTITSDMREGISMQDRFKSTFSRGNVKVHFIGAWDTVSSVGIIRDKTLPGTTDGMESICYFRHALALHEYRVKFLPEYANGGDGPSAKSTDGALPHTKEVWFTGSHSDIGGGNTENADLKKFGPALRWMSFEAVLSGLRIEPGPREWEPIQVSDSMTSFWKIFEYLPIRRLTYEGKETAASWPPHFSAGRSIMPRQLIHRTVQCRPEWQIHPSRLEEDAYTEARALLDSLNNTSMPAEGTITKMLKLLWSSPSGRQSLTDLEDNLLSAALKLASSWCQEPSTNFARARRLHEFRLLRNGLSYGSLDIARNMQPLSVLLGTSMEDNYETFPFALHGHTRLITSVAFVSCDIVVSGSEDGTLRLGSIRTGQPIGEAVSEHTEGIRCVAVSQDGSLIASGSLDRTIRTWKVSADGITRIRLIEQADCGDRVFSLAFSPDGSRIVSGSFNGHLTMWNATTGEQIWLAKQGHTNSVLSVAFSPDGTRIVSGSSDDSVRLWNARTLQPLGNPLPGQTSSVHTTAFSPDGGSLASGSYDGRIRIWDAKTRQLRHTLAGHTNSVLSVAFSPDSRHIASGSGDQTVRIWDAVTGKAIGVLKGHTRSVDSVTFSPDGTRIVSGSFDHSIRVWDRIPVSDQTTI